MVGFPIVEGLLDGVMFVHLRVDWKYMRGFHQWLKLEGWEQIHTKAKAHETTTVEARNEIEA